MIKHFVTLALLLGLFPFVGSAQSLTDFVRAETQTPQMAQTQWQESYDVVQTRKRSAKRKMYVGLGAVGGGLLITAVYGSGDDRLHSEEFTTGMLISAGGGVVFAWGLMQYLDASDDMNRLNDRRPADSASIRLTDHQAIRLGAGSSSSVSYALSW